MKYYVTYKIEARYVAEVEANSLEAAMKKAEYKYYDADFGVARDIDAEAIMVEDENGNYVLER
jgi:phosphomannomutase